MFNPQQSAPHHHHPSITICQHPFSQSPKHNVWPFLHCCIKICWTASVAPHNRKHDDEMITSVGAVSPSCPVPHWGILRCRWRCLILAQSWLAEEKTKDFNCHSLCNVQFRSTFSLIELIEWIILQNYYAVCCKKVMILWEREIQFLHEMRSWPTLRQEEKILELKSEVSVCVCLHLRMPSSEQRSWQKNKAK